MKNFEATKPYFTFTRSQRTGILALLSIIVLIQTSYFFIEVETPNNSPDEAAWLQLQDEIDSLKSEKADYKPAIYPFNPNFITDFKGYRLGMSVAEIDRLHAFRKQNKYVNSAADFQSITKVSDSLLATMSPHFKFPDWVTNRKSTPYQSNKYQTFKKSTQNISVIDINIATADDLIKVYGIGPALSERIIKQRELLGCFVDMGQMRDIWGLSDDVIANLNLHFKVLRSPDIKKIPINEASISELAKFPYFRYALAKKIVTYRSMNGDIKSSEDLVKIPSFPIEKAEIIALYLKF